MRKKDHPKTIKGAMIKGKNRPLHFLAVASMFLLCLFLIFYYLYAKTSAAFSENISYQGHLANSSGSAVTDGSYNFRFKLYNINTGGEALWTEVRCDGNYTDPANPSCSGSGTDNRVSVSKGLFSVLLGSINPFGALSFNQDLYLEVDVGGSGTTDPSWTTLSPRKRLGAVSSAFEAKRLGGKTEDQFATLAEEEIITAPWRFNINSSDPGITITQSGAGDGLVVNGTTLLSALTISSSSPSDEMIDSTNGSYTKLTKSDSNNQAARYNRVSQLGTSDPYKKLLLHMDGNNNGTVFTDSSDSPHSISLSGSPVTKTDIKEFGTASGYFNGSSNLEVANSSDWEFGSGDFTIDWWEYRTTNPTYASAIARDSSTYPAFLLGLAVGSGDLNIYMSSNGSSWDVANGKLLGANTLNQWVHYAVVRNGDNFYTFRNGVQQDTWASSASLVASSLPLRIGRGQDVVTEYFVGYLDEIRVSKGIARWTGNFTPSSYAYADSGGGSDYEVQVWKSIDSTDSSERGIQTFGDENGRTVLEGSGLRFDIAGAEKMRIDSNGNLGIGTTTPDSALHVIGGVCIEGTDSGCTQTGGNLKVGGFIDSVGGFKSNSTAGLSSQTITVGVDGGGTCTITVKGGIITATTCS